MTKKLYRALIVLSMLGILLGSPLRVQADITTGSISGYVRDQANNGLGNIPVMIGSENGDFVEATCTEPDGEYHITGIPLDSYIVEAAGNGFLCGSEFTYARTYWPAAPFADTATAVGVDSGQTDVTGIDFALGPGGTISGAVLNVNGEPITGSRVSIALNREDLFPTELYTCTDYDGTYEVQHIPLGVSYKLAAGVFPCPDNLEGYGTINAWPDSPTNSGGLTLSPTLEEPELQDIDFTLRALGDTPTGDEVLTFTSTGFITYENVSVPGTTTVEPVLSDPTPIPPNFKAVNYYELSTTATFSDAQVCFRYDESSLTMPESEVRLLHKESFVWVDVTDSGYPHTTDNVVCGTVSSFSPFVVAQASYDFSGFLQPVDNLPTLNVVKAGGAIPVRFSLGGDQGLNIFDAGYPRSQITACDSVVPVDGIEETISASSSGLSYDAGTQQYVYIWKTDKSWANTCRQLILKLDDGTFQRANFKFK